MSARPDSPLAWHGRPILTVKLAATRYKVGDSAIRMAVKRGLTAGEGKRERRVEPIDPPPIDDRTPAYWQLELDEGWDRREGRGANLRGHG